MNFSFSQFVQNISSTPISSQIVFFVLNFLGIFFTLIFYAILAWVIVSWIILFGAMRPENKFFLFLTQIVEPVLKPFRWARLGTIDFSPIVAILFLDFLVTFLMKTIEKFA